MFILTWKLLESEENCCKNFKKAFFFWEAFNGCVFKLKAFIFGIRNLAKASQKFFLKAFST